MFTILTQETFRKLVQHENSIYSANEPFEIEGLTFELVCDTGVEFSDIIIVSKGNNDIGYIWHEYDNCIHVRFENQQPVMLFKLDNPNHISEKEITEILNWFIK